MCFNGITTSGFKGGTSGCGGCDGWALSGCCGGCGVRGDCGGLTPIFPIVFVFYLLDLFSEASSPS